MAEARSTFGPVVLLGLASAGLAAVAGTKPWVTASGSEDIESGIKVATASLTSSPLSTGLAFVVLACWGVVLVTRGRFRRAIAVLAVVAALGNAATVALTPSGLAGRLRDEMQIQAGVELDGTSLTAWFWVAVVAAALVLVSTAVAVRFVGAWPEMGSKYDAPTGASSTDDAPPETNIDIWKALDEGRDPTA